VDSEILVLLLAACLRISAFFFKRFFAIQIRSEEGKYWFVAWDRAAPGAAATMSRWHMLCNTKRDLIVTDLANKMKCIVILERPLLGIR